ncbi:MAG: radical SAM protein, partial [Lachnospiraceae bacterium]|nr:radical SAM protein [Lachnospiraceae bacterium]
SLQSGSDTVLKRMNRRYTSEEYEAGCAILREYYENPAITTDIIVGFPGETKEEFEETHVFAEKIAFFEMHVFKYSKRAGTKAAVMSNQVPETVKTERSDRLLALEEKLSKDYRAGFIGREADILIEELVEIKGESWQVGHTREYIRVAIKADNDLTGQIVKVKLAGFVEGDTTTLVGE